MTDRASASGGDEAGDTLPVAPPRMSAMPMALRGVAAGAMALTLLLMLGLAVDHWPFAWDRAILTGLRTHARSEGLRAVAVDFTALGSVPVLILAVAGAAMLLLARGWWLLALATVASGISGGAVVTWVKHMVSRPRPDLVPHWVDVHNASFPSGHAAGSAMVYLTLAALATQLTGHRRARHAIVAIAVLLVGAIGASRVYLGVHWPSDVAAGWCFGTLWALGWWWATAAARRSWGGARQ
ncbi:MULTISPECIES: phosphatase PAP2 family protein [Sphingomonas]|jgi:membrane-associated phospholipid phosphatase|nr:MULTISPECIES: phosphatase PAP2 family protein [Sphingomonas]MBB4050051.1 undecaprenyl-diphosphatase [Sphingomonas zeae]MDK8185057.1 phosphatase PAP2 family protein [Sphingomonas zeae]MDK8215832.1 phosphatase PAP2 family protein [Sphingomonas sp. UMB7805-LC452B]